MNGRGKGDCGNGRSAAKKGGRGSSGAAELVVPESGQRTGATVSVARSLGCHQ